MATHSFDPLRTNPTYFYSIYSNIPDKHYYYCSCAGGVIGMTKALAKEFGGRGICVNAVCPGTFRCHPIYHAINHLQLNFLTNCRFYLFDFSHTVYVCFTNPFIYCSNYNTFRTTKFLLHTVFSACLYLHLLLSDGINLHRFHDFKHYHNLSPSNLLFFFSCSSLSLLSPPPPPPSRLLFYTF